MFLLIAELATEPATLGAEAGYIWLIVKMFIILGLVLLIAVGVLKYILPKLGVAKQRGGGRYVEIVARCALDTKKSVWIVKVGKRHFLLGSGDSAVNCLAELEANDLEGRS